nr:MAG TPA: hypothetical protein [Crassvirales sp.]
MDKETWYLILYVSMVILAIIVPVVIGVLKLLCMIKFLTL